MKFKLTRTSEPLNEVWAEDFIEQGFKPIHDGKRYHVEINSLEELMKFVERYGEIVLDDGMIEIYDTYRE